MKNNKIKNSTYRNIVVNMKIIFFRLSLFMLFGMLIGTLLSIVRGNIEYNDFDTMTYIFFKTLKMAILPLIVISLILTLLSLFRNRNYSELLTEELDIESFLKKTEKLYEKSKSEINKEIYKLNFFAGYYNWGKFDKAKEWFEKVDKEKFFEIIKNTENKEALKVNYYHALALLLYGEGKKEEALEIYNEKIKDSIKNDILKMLLLYENEPEKMISEIEEALTSKNSKISEMFYKYNLAENKEKIGKTEEAENLYKEVIENGNQLYIVNLAEEKLK